MAAELQSQVLRIDGTELLEALVTSVFVLDHELRVDYLNAAAQTLLGLSPNQVLGRTIAELARGAETLLPLFDRARAGGEGVVQRELAWPGAGGVDRILDCAVTQITIGQDAARILLEIEDITQHRRLTRENALIAQLGGSRLMVRQLAHEIKNPLGGLRGAAQLLERELLDPSLREYTRVIISEADRLTSLLDSMLGPGRPPAKQLINVHELLERVYHLLRSEAADGVTVDRDYDPSLPPLTATRCRHCPAPPTMRRGSCCAPAQPSMSASARGATGWWRPFNSRTTALVCPPTFATRSFIRSFPGAPTEPALDWALPRTWSAGMEA